MSNIKKIFALSNPEDPRVSVINIDRDSNDYIKFGSDNLFPQAVAEVNRNSTVNRALIRSKVTYTIGTDMTCDDSSVMDKIWKVNEDESLRNVLKKCFYDDYSFGNAYLEIVTNAKKSFFKIYHQDSTTVRLAKKKDSYIIHPDWSRYTSTKSYAKIIGKYPNFTKSKDDGFLHSIIHIKDYEPEFVNYGVPEWLSAMKVATIAHKTDKWNLSRIENSFRTSGVLVVEDDVKSIEEAQKLKDSLLEKFTEEGNNNQVFVIVKEPGGAVATQFTPMTTTDEGDWLALHEQASKDLVVAHNWRRSLIGFSDNTGFDTDRILNDYSDVLYNVIRPKQATYLEVIYNLFAHFGYNAETLNFTNQPPVSPKKTAFTKMQIEGIFLIKENLRNGLITYKQAINIMQLAYLITKEEAEGLI